MPFAGFKNFDECLRKIMKDGKSKLSAQKICGSLQSKHENKKSKKTRKGNKK